MSASVRSKGRPAPGPARDYHFPRWERRRLDNGLQLVVAPVHKLPIITIAVVFEAGAVSEPAGREGLAQLTASLLLEGTKELNGAQLTERFERLGASVDAYADWDSSTVTATALTENLDETFALLSEVLRSPAFDERELARLRAERLAELLQLRTEPRGLADELSLRFLYEAGSRYARPDDGDEVSVGSIERSDVTDFFARRYRPAGATMIIAGDITADAAEKLVQSRLGDWQGTAPERSEANDRPASAGRGVHIIAKPDAPQSELRIGHVGIPRNHPDYFPVVVMNALLGGLFNSRINMNLREVHGYTYGASSGFDWRRQAGPFSVSTAVKSDITDAAAREVLNEIDRIRTERVTADELSLATNYLDGVFPIRFETTASIAGALQALVVYGLPDDYYDRYRETVRSITIDQVLEAAQRHIDPERLQMIVVGDQGTIAEPLTALGVGPVTVYDTKGKPLGHDR